MLDHELMRWALPSRRSLRVSPKYTEAHSLLNLNYPRPSVGSLIYVQVVNYRLRELISGGGAAQVPGKATTFPQSGLDSLFYRLGRRLLAQVLQQHCGGKNHSSRIGNAFTGSFRSAPMNCLKDRTALADVGSRDQAQSSHQTSGQIRKNVSVKVGSCQKTKLLGMHYQPH